MVTLPRDSPPARTAQHAVLRVEYDGGSFAGWSRQPGALATVEQELATAFERLGCLDVHLRCAGRTDAGVHASAQVVDVRYIGSVPPDRLAVALVAPLPATIAVVDAGEAPAGFDARGDATSRAYEYRVLQRATPSALRAGRVLHHPRPIDRALLDQAAAAVLGQHHFRAFTRRRTEHRYFDRTVVASRWFTRGDELVYEIRANSFLRRMVRMLVGSMLAVARGEITLEQFVALLDEPGDSDTARTTAPSHGLCLVDVTWEPIAGLPLPPGWRRAWTDADRARPCTLPFSSVG